MILTKKNFPLDLVASAIALGVFLITLAPTVTWRNNGADSGDLVTAAFTLGVPHPSGYPLYTLLAAIFSHLPLGEPARNVGAFSALAASAAIFFLARAGRSLLGDVPLARYISPCIALAFAVAPAFWSQATIAEVNALAAFFSAALFAALLSNSPRRLDYAAAIFGLALAHHLTIILLLPSAIILLGTTRYTRQQCLRAAILAGAPLMLYAYLPIAAAAHPPVNWGNPETLAGFFWVVTGAPYHAYLLALPPAEIFSRIGQSIQSLFTQFTIVGVALGLWGAVRMATDAHTRRVFIAMVVAFALTSAYAITYNSRDSFIYLMPAYFVFALWVMVGIADGVKSPLNPHLLRGAGGILLLLLPFYNLAANFNAMNISGDYTARDYAAALIDRVPGDALIIADGDEHYFALMYYRHVMAREKKSVIVSGELLQYDWYWDNVRRNVPGIDASLPSLPERTGALIEINLAQGHGVYVTTRGDAFAAFALEPMDSYYRVTGRLH